MALTKQHLKETDTERSPLLHNNENIQTGNNISIQSTNGTHEDSKCSDSQNSPPYSVTRVKVVMGIAMALYAVSQGPISQIMSQYLMWRIGRDDPNYANISTSGANTSACDSDDKTNSSSTSSDKYDQLQAQVSDMMEYLSYVNSLTAMVMAIFISSSSDYVGRRTTFIIAFTGMSINMILQTLIVCFHLPLWIYYIAVGIGGLTGAWFSVVISFLSVTADITKGTSSRVLWVTIVAAMFNVSSAGSVICIGFIIQDSNYELAISITCVSVILAYIVIVVFLPETCPKPEEKAKYNPIVGIKQLLSFFIFDGTLRKKLTFSVLLLMFLLVAMKDGSLDVMDTLYQLHQPFCWSPSMIGYYKALKQGCSQFLMVFLLKFLQTCGIKDDYIALVGLLFQTGQFVLEGLAATTWQLLLVPVIGIQGYLVIPTLRALMSTLAAPDKQGALFGSICVVEALGAFVSSALYNSVYSATVFTFPGSVYLVMAGCNLLAFFLFFVYLKVKED